MLASTPNILQMCSFDATKSTKGASKLRRDLINSEIANLRDLLPLPSSTRQRLSQLQLMALVCVYVRKANYFQHAFRKHDLSPEVAIPHFGFSKALSGFLMMLTQNGKLLYISDNAAEYLGHSMEDLLIHGDSVYDIIEKQDHQTIQAELMRTPNPLSLSPDTRIFLCRMNVSRNARRQMRFGDQKVVLIQGHFVSFLPLCSRNEPVFLATCTPVAMPETRECVVQGSTNVFTSIHSMDMKFLHIDRNGEFHLGYNKNSVQSLSWYDFVHWEHLREAQSKHRLITQSEQERSCILLLRLQTNTSNWIWVHVVLQVKDSNDSSQQPIIVCTNQVLSEREAVVMRANSWLYQFYSLHSKMHYGLAYEAHTTRLPTYYPTTTPTVMSHAYHHAATAGGGSGSGSGGSSGEASTVPLHSMPYHIHSAITPLNGTPGHRHPHHPQPHHPHHPQAVLQYSPQAGSLPYPSIVAAVSATTQTIHESVSLTEATKQTKRAHTPQIAQQEDDSSEPNNKRTNLSHHSLPPPPTSTYHHPRASSFAYPSSVFGGGFSAASMTSVTELGTVVPGYYSGPQVLTSVPYHAQIGHHFRSQSKFSLFEESDTNDLEQSLTPINTEEVSNIITFSSPTTAYLKYASTVVPYQYHELPSIDRDLDKGKSPESIISNTSDYGSMTSQSPLTPPSAFEKPYKKEGLNFLCNNSINSPNSNSIYGSPIYTDLSTSRPQHVLQAHHQLDKDFETLDHRFTFPNVIWGYNGENGASMLSLQSISSSFGRMQEEVRDGNVHLVSAEHAQQQSSGHQPVSATGMGMRMGMHMGMRMQPQVVTTTDIPSQISSPVSTAPGTAPSVRLSPSSCGVGRASGYGGISSSIAKGERSSGKTAQNQNQGTS